MPCVGIEVTIPPPKPSFCDRVSALAGHSLTVAWAYALILGGLALDALPFVADLFNAPEVAGAITQYTGPYTSHVLKLIGVITALARVRTLWKGTS